MALPVINTTPKYEMVVPSTKKKVRYRPFLVKEQKILLLAYETKDRRSIVRAMLDVIGSCVDESVDVYHLTTFDVDYMFTQIRAKSVGEKVGLNIECTNCNVQNEVEMNLEDIKIDVEKQDMVVKINEKISLKLKYPDYSYFVSSNDFFELGSTTDTVIDVVISCLDSVMSDDENIKVSDEPKEEIIRFIESLSTEQFDKVQNFIRSMPNLRHELKFKCVNCGEQNTRLLEGLEDFF